MFIMFDVILYVVGDYAKSVPCYGMSRRLYCNQDHPMERVSVFTFPINDDIRQKWISMIPRENLEVHDGAVVVKNTLLLTSSYVSIL